MYQPDDQRCVINVECSSFSLECRQVLKPNKLNYHHTQALKNMCPSLFTSKGSDLDNIPLCCGEFEMTRLDLFLKFYQDFFTCTPCWLNFKEVFCQLICSPNQADFIRIVNISEPTDRDKELYFDVIYFLSTKFSQGAIQSCGSMKGKGIVSSLCNESFHYMFCKRDEWFKEFTYRIPFLHDFRIRIKFSDNVTDFLTKGDEIYRPMNEHVYSCHGNNSGDLGSCPNNYCQETYNLSSNTVPTSSVNHEGGQDSSIQRKTLIPPCNFNKNGNDPIIISDKHTFPCLVNSSNEIESILYQVRGDYSNSSKSIPVISLTPTEAQNLNIDQSKHSTSVEKILQRKKEKCSYFKEFIISSSSLVVITMMSLMVIVSRSLLKRRIHHLSSQSNGFIWWIKGRGDDLEILQSSEAQDKLILVSHKRNHET
ncbi:uncharacterized protein LOC141852164 isoform X2 [Brevipalpus obovatus]